MYVPCGKTVPNVEAVYVHTYIQKMRTQHVHNAPYLLPSLVVRILLSKKINWGGRLYDEEEK